MKKSEPMWTIRYWVGGSKNGKWKKVLGKYTQMEAQEKMREISNMGYRSEARTEDF